MKQKRPRAPDTSLNFAGVLYGWDEIAAYLRRSKVTVHRWHTKHPLPIVKLGSHVATPRVALDIWVLDSPTVTRMNRRDVAPRPTYFNHRRTSPDGPVGD